MPLHHKPMLIGVQKGVKNEAIAMLFVQNTGCLDFQRHQNAQFTPSSFLVQEFTKGILLSFFRTKKKKTDYSSSGHLQGLPVRISMGRWAFMPRNFLPNNTESSFTFCGFCPATFSFSPMSEEIWYNSFRPVG